MLDTLLLLAFLLAVWVFYDGIRVREIALKAGREYCAGLGVQFLDETVCRELISLARDGDGRLRIRRSFGFEFCSDGERRYRGVMTMLGKRVTAMEMELHRVLH